MKVLRLVMTVVVVGVAVLPLEGCRLFKVVDDGGKVVKKIKPGVGVFSSLADNVEDFTHIYKRPPTTRELKYVGTAKAEFRALGLPHSLDGSKEGFLKYIDSAEEEHILVTGHNEEGLFHFTDGATLPLNEMARQINQRGKKHVFISCNARNYVSGPAAEVVLTEEEAVNVIRNVNNLLSRQLQITEERVRILREAKRRTGQLPKNLGELEESPVLFVTASDTEELAIQAQINKSIKLARQKTKVKYVVTTGSIGGGVVIVSVAD